MRRHDLLVIAVLVAACAEPTVSPPPPSAAPIAPLDAGPPGDAVLAQARTSIDHGVLADASRAAILASSSPAHARARALLEALVDAPPAVIPSVAAPPTAMPESPAIAVPPADPPPPPVEPASAPTKADPAPPKTKPTLEKLAMRSTSRGASLSIHTGRGVLVGVANQPEAGVVRLVLEDVAAAAKVLGARPGVAGARVKDVSAGPKSVRITLQLDDGWRFGGVSRTGSGARVDLVAP